MTAKRARTIQAHRQVVVSTDWTTYCTRIQLTGQAAHASLPLWYEVIDICKSLGKSHQKSPKSTSTATSPFFVSMILVGCAAEVVFCWLAVEPFACGAGLPAGETLPWRLGRRNGSGSASEHLHDIASGTYTSGFTNDLFLPNPILLFSSSALSFRLLVCSSIILLLSSSLVAFSCAVSAIALPCPLLPLP